MTKPHDQLAYPLLIRFCTRHDPRTHQLDWSTAVAICADELPNLETDIGACCMLQRRPRYRLDGVETPAFDPTIPDDLREAGWYWHGERLSQDGPHGSIGIGPRASLEALWDAARKLDIAYASSARAWPGRPPRRSARGACPRPPAVVVVVDRPHTVQQPVQLALW